MSLTNEDLTWRFELRLPDPDEWVPVTEDLVDDKYGGYTEYVGTIEMPGMWQDAEEAAPSELDEALPDLVEAGDPLGMTGARIVVWEGIGTDTAPAYVLEATADQLAASRLACVNRQVQHALQKGELARTRVRAQIIKAATEDRLGRNTIARLVSGALTRRLVLQLLAGYDLVEGIRDSLDSWTDRYRRWYPDPPVVLDEEFVEKHLGPFCHGPIRLNLEANGQVYLSLIDIDGPHESVLPLTGDIDLDEEAERAHRHARTERVRAYVEEVLPMLTKAGFVLHRRDGSPASVEDLEQTISGAGLLVNDG